MCLVVLLGLLPAGASSANISHSYKSAESLQDGSLVSLNPDRSDYVEAANTSNAKRLLGVVVDSEDSLLAVDAQDGSAQVATSGTASALVSTINGDIKVGDQIAVSPFAGVGMKAGPSSRIIGLAQTAFSADSAGVASQQVTDKGGKQRTVYYGLVRVNISVGTASSAGNAQDNLSGLQRLARSLTGHVVSTPRIILSLVVACAALIALITLIYASIYGSIISIGRNPLAKYAVFRSLGGVLLLASLLAAVAGLTIFFLLR